MDITDVAFRVFFLVAIAFLGIYAGRRFHVSPRDISSLLVYFVSPAVILVSVLRAPDGTGYLLFTLGAFIVCSSLALAAYGVGAMLWGDSTRNLFASSGGTGNTGYFGLPLAFGVFGDVGGAIAVFIIIGVNLYEFTVGYYLASLGNASVLNSLKRMLRLPTMYAFLLALGMKEAGLLGGEALLSSLDNFKGAYSVLGMMVIGITLSRFKSFEIDKKYLISALSWKFFTWPTCCFLIVLGLGSHLTELEQAVVMMMSAVPMAGNAVVIANELDVHPEKAATAVMASTLLALVSVPTALALL